MDNYLMTSRRAALRRIGEGALVLASLSAATEPSSGQDQPFVGASSGALRDLIKRLSVSPRRRRFDAVPLILTNPQDWDYEAAMEVLSYKSKPLQVWENTDLAAPWPGLMREAMNGQVFAFKNTEFLAVSATHGIAHLALFSQSMWDKYQLATLTERKFSSNTLIVEKEGVSPTDDIENPSGFYSPSNNNVVSLQRRGAVFIACHDSIHAIARTLHDNQTFSASPADKIAADLTNNLIPGAVLVPSVVAFLVELQQAGFTYAKGG
jgi:intracellular sulfur oxidation DsrE/DsrF family protein